MTILKVMEMLDNPGKYGLTNEDLVILENRLRKEVNKGIKIEELENE